MSTNDPTKMRDAYVVFKADMNSSDPYVREYLYAYFREQQAFQIPLSRTKDVIDSGTYQHYRPNEIIIENDIMKTNFLFNYILVNSFTGKIGKVGEILIDITIRKGVSVYVMFGQQKLEFDMSSITYRKQLTETTYEEIEVHGPLYSHDIGGKTVLVRSLDDAIDTETEDTGLYLPVSKRIVDQFSNMFTRSQIYQSTLSITVYALDVTKVRFYQRKLFGRLLQIAAIIFTIYTAGAGSSTLTWATALNVVKNIVIQMIITMGLSLLVKVIGIENALLIATVAAIGMIATGTYDSTFAGLPDAANFLALTNATFGASQIVLSDELKSLQDDYRDFLEESKAEYDKIKEVNDMLSGQDYDLLDIITRSSNDLSWETPDMFYNRTIHTGNPGVETLNVITNFVNQKLLLPFDRPIVN